MKQADCSEGLCNSLELFLILHVPHSLPFVCVHGTEKRALPFRIYCIFVSVHRIKHDQQALKQGMAIKLIF